MFLWNIIKKWQHENAYIMIYNANIVYWNSQVIVCFLQIAAQEQLSHELSKHHDLEMKLDDVKENFSRVLISKESLEALLEEEKSKVLFMKDQIKDMEVLLFCMIVSTLLTIKCPFFWRMKLQKQRVPWWKRRILKKLWN